MFYGIHDHDSKDWVREPRKEGNAILAFDDREKAEKRAAAFLGFDTYYEVVMNGWGEVMPLTQKLPVSDEINRNDQRIIDEWHRLAGIEKPTAIKTKCNDCQKEVIVPSVTDCGMSFQTAPAKCECGWEQPGRKIKCGFIADNPDGYSNLRTMQGEGV
jgi:hypothetical protein